MSERLLRKVPTTIDRRTKETKNYMLLTSQELLNMFLTPCKTIRRWHNGPWVVTFCHISPMFRTNTDNSSIRISGIFWNAIPPTQLHVVGKGKHQFSSQVKCRRNKRTQHKWLLQRIIQTTSPTQVSVILSWLCFIILFQPTMFPNHHLGCRIFNGKHWNLTKIFYRRSENILETVSTNKNSSMTISNIIQ